MVAWRLAVQLHSLKRPNQSTSISVECVGDTTDQLTAWWFDTTRPLGNLRNASRVEGDAGIASGQPIPQPRTATITTITLKDGVVAADSQATSNFKWESSPKISRVAGGPFQGHVLAIAGRAALCDAIKAQVESGEFVGIPCVSEDDGACALLVGPKGGFLLESDQMSLMKVPKVFSIGSGCRFAMGAMYAGASAVDAVKIAAKLCEYTGGRIHSMKVAT